MAHSLLSHCLLSLLLVSGASVSPANAQAPAGPPLSVEEVVKLWKTNVSEEVIITMIKKNAKAFNLSTEEVLELRKVGLSDNVVKFLLDPSQPYTPAPAASSQPPSVKSDSRTPAKNYPGDGYAAQVPLEPGLYHLSDGVLMKTDIKLLLGEKQGAGVGKVVMKKGKAIAYLLGPTAKMRVNEIMPVFYLRLPEGKAIEEVVLVALEQKKDRREIEIGQTLDKPELKAEDMRPYDSLEVGPRLFKITTSAKLTKGEYLFFLLGSAEPPKGSPGKGYDFGVEGQRR